MRITQNDHDPSNPPGADTLSNTSFLDTPLAFPRGRTVETCEFPISDSLHITAIITRIDQVIHTLKFQQSESGSEREGGFLVELHSPVFALQLERGFSQQRPLKELFELIENAHELDANSCSISPNYHGQKEIERVNDDALLRGKSYSHIRQPQSLSEMINGTRRDLLISAKSLSSSQAVVLSAEFVTTSDAGLELSLSVTQDRVEILREARVASAEVRPEALAEMGNSVFKTFDLAQTRRFLQYCHDERGLVLPSDPTGCEPRFIHGRSFSGQLLEVDPACLLSELELQHSQRSFVDQIAFAVTGEFSPCRYISMAVGGTFCRTIGMTFANGSRLSIVPWGGEIFRGSAQELREFIDSTLGKFIQNPFSLLFPDAFYSLQSAAHMDAPEQVSPTLLAKSSVAYHLWSREQRRETGLFPHDFRDGFMSVDLSRVSHSFPVLEGERFGMVIELAPSGIGAIQVLERRHWFSKIWTTENYRLCGRYLIAQQASLSEAEILFDSAIDLARSLSGSRQGWYSNNFFDRFLRERAPFPG